MESLPVSRLQRIMQLMVMFQSGPRFNASELAKEFDVSRRTIFRDINILRDAGVPIEYDEELSGYYLKHEFRFKSAGNLTTDELARVALATCLSLLQAVPKISDSVKGAITKLLDTAHHNDRREVCNLLDACMTDLLKMQAGFQQSEILDLILEGIRKRKEIRLTLQPDEQTKVAPYRLIASFDHWILIGRSSVHRKVQEFNIQTISKVELLDSTFFVPQKFNHPMQSKSMTFDEHPQASMLDEIEG